MKFFQEVTAWPDSTPNHTYLLDDSKGKMFGYVAEGTGKLRMVATPLRFDARFRKFKQVANTFGWREPRTEPQGREWKVSGSRGDVYTVAEVDGQYSCSCSGFKFRGQCRHIKELAK